MTPPNLTRRLMPAALLVALLAVVPGCGTSTHVTGEWQEKATAVAPFRHLLVVGVSPNSRTRRSFETALAEQLTAGSTRATASVQTRESVPELTPEIVAAMVRSSGADGVLVTRLASRKVEAREKGGRTGVKTQQPTNINGGTGLREFFSLEYREYEEPPETSAQSTVVVETSLYSARDAGRLVYVMTTTAEFREDRDDVVGDVARAMAGHLRREGLVP